jgi:hypothetical protein
MGDGRVTDAPTMGTLAGTVRSEVGAPITGVAIMAGAVRTTTINAAGAFAFSAPQGRTALTVSAPGHIPFSRTIGITSDSPDLGVTLLPLPAPIVVTSAGSAAYAASGGIDLGRASVEISAGAYTSDATLTLSWIDAKHIYAASGRALFLDEHGTHRFVGQLYTEASRQPAISATLHVGVPAGMFGDESLVAYEIHGGEMGERVAASDVTGGVASFVLPRLSTWTVVRERALTASLPASTTAWMLLDGRLSKASGIGGYEAGDDIPAGARVSGNAFAAAAYNGVQIWSEGGATLDAKDDGMSSATCFGLCSLQAEVPPDPSRPAGKRTFRAMAGTESAAAAPGTICRLSQDLCARENNSVIARAEVTEGNVDLSFAGHAVNLPAGKQSKGCDGCTEPTKALCDCASTAEPAWLPITNSNATAPPAKSTDRNQPVMPSTVLYTSLIPDGTYVGTAYVAYASPSGGTDCGDGSRLRLEVTVLRSRVSVYQQFEGQPPACGDEAQGMVAGVTAVGGDLFVLMNACYALGGGAAQLWVTLAKKTKP